MARKVGVTMALATMDSSYSSKARMWHFLHLEEAGKTFSGVSGPPSSLAAYVPCNHPTPRTRPRTAKPIMSAFTCRAVHPIASLAPNLAMSCHGRWGGLEGFRPERQHAGLGIIGKEALHALPFRVRRERFQVPVQQRGGRLGNQAVRQHRVDLQTFAAFTQRQIKRHSRGRAPLDENVSQRLIHQLLVRGPEGLLRGAQQTAFFILHGHREEKLLEH